MHKTSQKNLKTTLKISGYSASVGEQDLRALCETFGTVLYVNFVADGKPHALVEFQQADEAEDAHRNLNLSELGADVIYTQLVAEQVAD